MRTAKNTAYNPQDKLNALVNFLFTGTAPDEEWRELKIGYGFYFVSNKGRVLSLYNNEPRVLKQYYCNDYSYVRIDGKDRRVNRLVAKAFLPNPEHKKVVHHIDGLNKRDNSLSNLKWATHSENTREYYKLKKEQERAAEGL